MGIPFWPFRDVEHDARRIYEESLALQHGPWEGASRILRQISREEAVSQRYTQFKLLAAAVVAALPGLLALGLMLNQAVELREVRADQVELLEAIQETKLRDCVMKSHWIHQTAEKSLATERKPGEGAADWLRRHKASLAEVQEIYPPD